MSEREKELEHRIAELESECRELRAKARLLDANSNRAGGCENEDENTAQTSADQAAWALNNVRLFDQFDEAEVAKATVEVVVRAMALGDLGLTLETITHGIKKVLNCDAVVLYSYDEASSRLHHPPTTSGMNYPDRAAAEEGSTGSIVHRMLDHDELYVVNNVADDSLFRDRRFTVDEQIKSCIAVPLRAASKRVGVMFVNYHTPHQFTSEDLCFRNSQRSSTSRNC